MSEPSSPLPLGVTRRDAVRVLATGLGAILVAGCAAGMTEAPLDRSNGRFVARPGKATLDPLSGLHPLRLGSPRDGLIYGPPTYNRNTPVPLILLLHGGSQSADALMGPYLANAIVPDAVLLAPNSRGASWDAITGNYGVDIDFIDASLELAFSRFNIDPARIAVVGFSDGASYSMGIGRANGDLFSHVVVHSGGFLINTVPVGKPRVMVTHGTSDNVLLIDFAARKFVPELRVQGYDVTYVEFEGSHQVTTTLLRNAALWAVS